MENKEITIEDLARMIQEGFRETAKKEEVNTQFKEVNVRFDKIENRFEKIEKLLLAEHQRRIEKLETEVKELRELLAVKYLGQFLL